MNANDNDDGRPLMLGGRLFWQKLQPNGSRRLVADDGRPVTEAEWQEFCAFAKAVTEATARKVRAMRAEVAAMLDAKEAGR